MRAAKDSSAAGVSYLWLRVNVKRIQLRGCQAMPATG